jgi:hypothetical protein
LDVFGWHPVTKPIRLSVRILTDWFSPRVRRVGVARRVRIWIGLRRLSEFDESLEFAVTVDRCRPSLTELHNS